MSTTATPLVSKQIAVENLLIFCDKSRGCDLLLPAASESPSDSSKIISSVSIRPSDVLNFPAAQTPFLSFVSRRGQSPSRVRSLYSPVAACACDDAAPSYKIQEDTAHVDCPDVRKEKRAFP